MGATLDTLKFSEMIKSKRGNQGLRQLAEVISVSASTLSRIEQGRLPDIDTYLKICNWLEVSPSYFTKESQELEEHKVQVIAHLRADKTLPNETSIALIRMIDLAYESVKEK